MGNAKVQQVKTKEEIEEDNVTRICFFPSQLQGNGKECLVFGGEIVMIFLNGKSIPIRKKKVAA